MHDNLIAYSGYYTDSNILKSVASGGAASILGETIIGLNGVVYGACYADGFKKVKFLRATSLGDLEDIKGSKYVYSEKKVEYEGIEKNVYEVVAQDLNKGKIVLFSGLGCDIGGILSYCLSKNINIENLYTVDLICQGPTFSEAQRSYVEMLEEKYKSRIKTFSVRFKKDGWVPPYVHAEFENGKIFNQKWTESELFYSFSRFAKKTCTQCKFKGDNHRADITIGDFWGLKSDMKGYNSYGVSVFLVRSKKGKSLMECIDRNRFILDNADASFIIDNNPMYTNSRVISANAEIFKRNLEKKGLHFAIQKNRGFMKALYCEAYSRLKGIYK